ncbi:type II secretion system protein GspG [Pseudobacteriovorax antillogorgiicola]|uniref:General secretion pathway protein G n=1 Tax=Pseudobacteriovorax antillogorgiicola TaxID=1513793 RepID=A0A1Y6CCS7_9BACT|nr:type II secretion system protein GspG [Pseudobacteriovorax antillogorgiicola]TCS48662.1 general secretion pathway protein G [Pseudobacteriovorax antillogorgiicola]SMF55075.1 general secretion pathway protein G [Pseudobacteriovorax antillogorgiicola]
MSLKNYHKQLTSKSQSGMSIIEILIVIALMGTVMALLVTNLTGTQEEANKDLTKLAIGKLEKGLELYRVHMMRYPREPEGLEVLLNSSHRKWRGPYSTEDSLYDPFGNKFVYKIENGKPIVFSVGLDGIVDTEDDIYRDDDAVDDEPVSFEMEVPTEGQDSH